MEGFGGSACTGSMHCTKQNQFSGLPQTLQPWVHSQLVLSCQAFDRQNCTALVVVMAQQHCAAVLHRKVLHWHAILVSVITTTPYPPPPLTHACKETALCAAKAVCKQTYRGDCRQVLDTCDRSALLCFGGHTWTCPPHEWHVMFVTSRTTTNGYWLQEPLLLLLLLLWGMPHSQPAWQACWPSTGATAAAAAHARPRPAK